MTVGKEEMSTATAVLRVLAMLALGVSLLPMLLNTASMLATVGQQCTPTSRTHPLGEQLEIIGVVFAFYAVLVAPAVIVLFSREQMLPKAILALVLGLVAIVYAAVALALLAIGTAC